MAVQFSDSTVDWKEARQWFIDSGVIPPTHRVTKPDVTLIDFARSLRDGVFLCSLLNKLRPDSVEYTARPVMQHSYLHNINAFLTACKHFNIQDSDLFADSELYDVDNFSKVMLALSKLSHTNEAISMGWKPFPSDEKKEEYTSDDTKDIYASLQEVSAQTAVYANISNLYDDSPTTDNYGYGDEKIYDSVISRNVAPPKEEDDKRKWIMNELFETERSFVNVLESIATVYCDTLIDQPFCSDELKIMFSIAQKLLPCHKTLQEGFDKCKDSNKVESEVTQCFVDAEESLLEYGIYAAHLPEAQEKAKHLQTRGDTCKIMSSCQDRNHQRFPLSDLLPVPIQRLLKYPLLIKDLEKCVRKRSVSHAHSQANSLSKTLGLLEDIAKYINVVKGDYDTVKAIQELQANLVDYKGPVLNQCGRYHLDGELKIKAPDPTKDNEPKSRWVFLFDKIFLITRKHYKIGTGIRYSVKSYHDVMDMNVENIPSYKSRAHTFKIKIEGKGEYVAIAKTDQLKFTWTEAINRAREVICPKAGKKGRHQFELANFDFPRKCSYCAKLLHGSYFQGYICSVCNIVSHTVCLGSQSPCSAVRPPRPPQAHPGLAHQHSLGATKIKKCVATQRYNAIGPRRETFLSFERGDEIDIVNSSDGDWWEGILVRTGARGLVSPNYLVRKTMLQASQSMTGEMPFPPDPSSPSTRRRIPNIADYPWYIGRKTRIDAEVALHRLRDGVFLIRESMDRPGEYAVALKWNGMPKHIKIMKSPQIDRFYVSDACDFSSIPELVEYYQKNTLGVSFPGVHTTLKYPYLDVVEGRVQTVNSRHPSVPGEGVGSTSVPRNIYPNGSVEGTWAEAACDFEGEQPGHLSFHKHDRVKIINTSTGRLGWWFGECNGKSGLFRSDHVFFVKDIHR